MIIKNSNELFSYLKDILPANPHILEAGSFNGSDTLRMAKLWPEATIYAFEPLPDRFAELKVNLSPFASAFCYQLALSTHNGTQLLYVAENPARPGKQSQASSLVEPKERLKISSIIFPSTIQVNTITLNTWAKENNINFLDLLWLDLQGHELEVLKNADQLLSNVNYIYLEISFIEAYKNQPAYHEIINFLAKYSFKEIGRDFENTTDRFFGNLILEKII